MARKEARIFTSIWDEDDDFVKLTSGAQRLYLFVLSQPDLSFCGVLHTAPNRWSKRCASGMTPKLILAQAVELHESRFVLLDQDTDELWVRSFIKLDGVLKRMNLVVALARDFGKVHSKPIRLGIVNAIQKAFPDGIQDGLRDAFKDSFTDARWERMPKDFRMPCMGHAPRSPISPIALRH